ncbi:MAG: PQQ-binding-like beta-propeller repeat protein [Planctomycetaceae bacterium]
MRIGFAFLLTLILNLPSATAADWPSWRGPHGNGVADGTGYPVTWSADNVKWQVELKGIGASTPAVAGDRIFLTSTQNGRNEVICYGMDGSEQWTAELGTSVEGKQGKDGTGANPSPVVDGEHVLCTSRAATSDAMTCREI